MRKCSLLCLLITALSTEQAIAAPKVLIPMAVVKANQSAKPPNRDKMLAAPPTDSTPHLGQGFDIFTGKLLARECAKADGLKDNVLASPSVDGGFFGEITSVTDVENSSGLSGSASLTYEGFSIGAQGGLQNSESFNTFNRFARVLVPVTREIKSILPRKLGVNGGAAFASKGDHSDFYETCGRMYVAAIHYGATLDGTITVMTTAQTSTSKHQEGVKAGIAGLFSVGVDHQAAQTKVDDNGTMTFTYTDTGGADAIPDATTLVEYGRNYRSKTPSARNVVSIELAPYRDIRTDPRVNLLNRVMEDKLQAISIMATKRNTARLQLNQLIFARDNPTLATTKVMDFAKAIKEQQDYLQKIADAVSACQTSTDLQSCKTAIGGVGDPPVSDVSIIKDA